MVCSRGHALQLRRSIRVHGKLQYVRAGRCVRGRAGCDGARPGAAFSFRAHF